jgi:putative ABC transport system permease protein
MGALYGSMNINKAKEIDKIKGVAAVSSNVYTSLNEEQTSLSLGPPPAIIGSDYKGEQFESFDVSYSSGRALESDDKGKVVVGADLVKKLDAKVGEPIEIRGKRYEVVGILNKTLTAPDNEVWMTLPDAQAIVYASLPEIIRAQTGPTEIVNAFTVYPEAGVDPNTLAETINGRVGDVTASGPKEFEEQVSSASGILNAILFGVALISLLVGGLSIINTMTMSISERVREIGIKKAVGAKTRDIMGEYLTEAGLIGLFGGLLGWSLGALTVLLVNYAMADSGTIIFLLSLRISLIALVFSVILGIIAGIYPAYHAVRVNIVKSLREG